VSHPLPRIFGRKKSSNELRYNEADVPLDDDLVPVLDNAAHSLPTRVISGKKTKADENGKVERRCMCCDSRVKVPSELQKFRCLCCLTINDLKPMHEQSESDKERPKTKRSETFADPLSSEGHLPVSLDRTRSLIDRCVRRYLESKCRQPEMLRPGIARNVSSREEVFGLEVRSAALQVQTPDGEQAGPRLGDPVLAMSPPRTPRETDQTSYASATVRDWAELKQFSGTRTDMPRPAEQALPERSEVLAPAAEARQAAPIPIRPKRKPPPPPMNVGGERPPQRLFPNGSLPTNGPRSPRPPTSPRLTSEEVERRRHADRIKTIFKPLEDYMIESFGNYQSLNQSFSTVRHVPNGRTVSESNIVTPPPELAVDHHSGPVDGLSELDAKTLLLGDIGENGSWWTGKLDRARRDKMPRRKRVGEGTRKPVTSRSPNINWSELDSWYQSIHAAGQNWRAIRASLPSDDPVLNKAILEDEATVEAVEAELVEARAHAVRTLLKLTENILKRPSRPIKEPEDARFLLLMLSNPSLYPRRHDQQPSIGTSSTQSQPGKQKGKEHSSPVPSPKKSPSSAGSQHNGLLKRIFGLLSCLPDACHRYLVNWFARYDEVHFVKTVDLVASFVTHRIARRSGRARRGSGVDDGGLIPTLSGSAMSTSAQLHSAMGLSGSVKKGDASNTEPDWAGDWQIKAAAKVMSLLFAANNIWQGALRDPTVARMASLVSGTGLPPQAKARRSGQLLHTSSFYNTLLDYQDIIADFKVWETRRDKFAFCQYPLFLSMGNKIKILEYDARRQMEIKAREAYFDAVIRQRAIDGNFHLRVRRECLVDDSLRQISQAVGAGQEELKKGLRVHFTGEEGVDAGGPRKEWFLMLVRDIFDPQMGMFVYDEDSNTCYFNANSFETSDQYYLVGALLGLAIYNSTILDVAFPPFMFRKLLAAAPSAIANASNVASLTGTKGQMTYTLSDLAEFRPSLAAGLQQLLDFDGDVEATYCRDFVAPVERYGTVSNVPLIANGDKTPVTNANRHEFVDAYVRYILDTAVSRQFEPFKRGFFTVCAGNALSLFRAEEIELLIRGSDEQLNIDSLKAVAVYENWKQCEPPHTQIKCPAESVPVIQWFWELFGEASTEEQRKLLTFITGTDRIPAVGATNLILRIIAGGDGWSDQERDRFPVARTCFNMLVLWRYERKEVLADKLWRAVGESEGFGLK